MRWTIMGGEARELRRPSIRNRALQAQRFGHKENKLDQSLPFNQEANGSDTLVAN